MTLAFNENKKLVFWLYEDRLGHPSFKISRLSWFKKNDIIWSQINISVFTPKPNPVAFYLQQLQDLFQFEVCLHLPCTCTLVHTHTHWSEQRTKHRLLPGFQCKTINGLFKYFTWSNPIFSTFIEVEFVDKSNAQLLSANFGEFWQNRTKKNIWTILESSLMSSLSLEGELCPGLYHYILVFPVLDLHRNEITHYVLSCVSFCSA